MRLPEQHSAYIPPLATAPALRTLVDLLLSGVRAIAAEQTRTGEIPSYKREANHALAYRRTLLISTFVDDALADFDLSSRELNTRLLDMIPAAARRDFFDTVRRIRRGIRSFIAWQEEPLGTWRFFGRGSGILPDAGSIAGAARVLLDPRGKAQPGAYWQRHADALARFRSPQGVYFTFLAPGGAGYGWYEPDGRPVAGHDALINALVVDYLAMVGGIEEQTLAYLQDAVRQGEALAGTANIPNPVAACYLLARVWRRASLPGLDAIKTPILAQLLARQQPDGGFGGPLSTAMALSAWLDLGYQGAAIDSAGAALARSSLPNGGWHCEDFVVDGYGSPAWTTALALSMLTRCEGEA